MSLLAGSGILIASLVGYATYLRPAYDEVSALRGTLIAKQNLFEEKKQAVDKVESLIKQYQGAGRLQDVVSMSLPVSEEVSSVFNRSVMPISGRFVLLFGEFAPGKWR